MNFFGQIDFSDHKQDSRWLIQRHTLHIERPGAKRLPHLDNHRLKTLAEHFRLPKFPSRD